MLGQSLEQTRKDLRLMPTQVLMQYKQNPGKQAVDGMPMDMLAGLELSRRAQLQQEQLAKTAPNPQQMPTVVDQAAMGLAGIAPQGAPQGVPQGAPQGAPAAPPQQMAQAPQPPAPPTQPTQQQPQKLATGGIASLGEMQDARDQGGMTPAPVMAQGMPIAPQNLDAPVQMLAGGGIVAFRNNKDQPVDADMPASYGDPMGTGAAEIANASTEEHDGRNLLERLLGVPAEPQWKRQHRAQQEVDRAEAGTKPSPTDGPVKPGDISVSQGGGQFDINAILKQLGGGGGGLDTSRMQSLIDRYMKPTEEETSYRNLVRDQMDAIRNRPSPEVSEADRKRIIDEQFQQNQAASKPYYDKMQQMIEEERAATKARYADKNADAMIRAGLRGLASRKPGMQGFFEGVTEGMDYHDKVSELEAAALAKSRQADMDLLKARMSDEKGDREAAQRYFDSYQKNKRDAETYEVQRANMLISAQKGIVDTEGKRERAGMGLQMALERANAQSENAALRNQLGLMGLAARMQGQGQKPMTINEKIAMEKRADELFSNPRSDAFQKYVGGIPNGQQLLTDLKNGRLKPDDPKFQSIVAQAKRRYVQDFLGGTRSSPGVTSYDQAASDLLGQ